MAGQRVGPAGRHVVSVEVVPLDAHDDEQWASFYRVHCEATFFERPYADAGGIETFRVNFTRRSVERDTTGLLARDADAVVGVAGIAYPLLDNTSLAWLSLLVAPEARRRGVGSALLEAVDSATVDRGRTVIQAEVPVPVDVAASGLRETSAGVAFASARGFTKAHAETHYVLDLPMPDDLLDRLAAHAAERTDGYRLLSWTDRCPDEWVEPWCRLQEAFVGQAPTGDLEVEPERWDEERLRDVEALRLAREQHTFVTAVVGPDGSLVGNTELILGAKMVRRGAMQSGTLVLPEHRGHRLGLAAKVANLRQLQAFDSTPRLVHTYNAGVNAPMLAVNAQLGFRAVEVEEEWQRRRST